MPYFHTIMNGTETVTKLVARLVSEYHDTHGPDYPDEIRDSVLCDNELDTVRDEFATKLIEFTKDVTDAPYADFIEDAMFEEFAHRLFDRIVNSYVDDFRNTPVYGEDA